MKGRPEAFAAQSYARPRGSKYQGDGGSQAQIEAFASKDCELCYGQYLANQRPNAIGLAKLMCQVPLVLWLLRGIDVCTDELAIPTWVMVPLYRYLRQEARYASILPQAEGAPPLRTTAHAGEDFRHLMEGVRRVFEVTRYLLATSGSRIGHGTALGFDPRSWAQSIGALMMPKKDRLWDLVFEWRLYAGFLVPSEFVAEAPPGRLAYVEVQIHELARDIFGVPGSGGPWEALDLAQLHHDLHTFMNPRPGSPLEPSGISVARALDRRLERTDRQKQRSAELLAMYLTDASSFRKGQELFEVTLSESEIGALVAAQTAVRRGVAARAIVVEILPTSNLMIGDMRDLRNHPILRLFPIEPDHTQPPILIAVGSDDPVTFNTSLVREYALLHNAARAAGHSDRDVQDWLDRIRQTSMDARFTLSWRPDSRERAEDILDRLECYLHIPRKHTCSSRPRVAP